MFECLSVQSSILCCPLLIKHFPGLNPTDLSPLPASYSENGPVYENHMGCENEDGMLDQNYVIYRMSQARRT